MNFVKLWSPDKCYQRRIKTAFSQVATCQDHEDSAGNRSKIEVSSAGDYLGVRSQPHQKEILERDDDMTGLNVEKIQV